MPLNLSPAAQNAAKRRQLPIAVGIVGAMITNGVTIDDQLGALDLAKLEILKRLLDERRNSRLTSARA